MKQLRTKEFENLDTALELLRTELEMDKLDPDITLQIEKGDSLEISYKNNHACLRCRGRVQIFRALGLLIQNLKEGKRSFELKENIQFEHSGVMFDVSRNAVLKTDTIKKLLRYMAVMGLNTAYLYMEDLYEVKKYP